jgi:uncharacterized membrane protein YhiD involved in acid resistance
VLIYYVLLFFFIFLTSLLLRELETISGLENFQKLRELIAMTFKFGADFQDVIVTLFSLLLAFIFSLPVAWIYTITKAGEDYDPSLVQTVVALSLVVAGVMIVVGSDLARAFGLVGVVAAVRFRNTLKDTKDAVYVFISVAIGMGCGFGVYHIAVFLSLAMSLSLYLLWKFKFGSPSWRERLGALAGGEGGKKNLQRLYEHASAGSLTRLEADLEQQVRLVQFAELNAEKDKKKVNAGLVIHAGEAAAAQQHVERALASVGGRWQRQNRAGIRWPAAERNLCRYFAGEIGKERHPGNQRDSFCFSQRLEKFQDGGRKGERGG